MNFGPFMCNAKCKSYGDPSCGETCQGLNNSDEIICPCELKCGVTSEKVALGSPCQADSDCASGDCVGFNFTTGGLCSQTCSTDADCASGMACVACAGCLAAAGLDGGADAGGAGQCFFTCSSSNGSACQGNSHCDPGTRAAGGSVTFCDPHLANGVKCQQGTDCISGRCGSGGACVPSGGIPTGQPCTSSPGDCASGQCCNSNCCGRGEESPAASRSSSVERVAAPHRHRHD